MKMKHAELIEKLTEFLGEDGIAFFKKMNDKWGRVDAVFQEGGIPHCVHFQEGMQVRNFLRQHVDWNCHKLDNKWVKLVEEVIMRV